MVTAEYDCLITDARALLDALFIEQANYKEPLMRAFTRVARLGAHPDEISVASAAVSGALARARAEASGWPSRFVTRARSRVDFYSLLDRAINALTTS